MQKRACSGTPIITLQGGVLSDPTGRIGNVVSNHQFQFDPAPGQNGAIFTSGFQVCDGTTLAVGGSTTFYACASGSFSNLYDSTLPNPPAQCSKVQIMVVGCDGQVSTPVQASQKSDGQIVSTSVAQISDGQLQAATAVPTTIPLVTGKGTAPPVSAPTGLPTVVAPYPIANFTGFPAGSTPSASAPGSPAPTSGSGSGSSSGSGTTPFTGAAASMDVRWAHFGLAAFIVLIGATVL